MLKSAQKSINRIVYSAEMHNESLKKVKNKKKVLTKKQNDI